MTEDKIHAIKRPSTKSDPEIIDLLIDTLSECRRSKALDICIAVVFEGGEEITCFELTNTNTDMILNLLDSLAEEIEE